MLSHKKSNVSDRLRRAKSSASMSSRCRTTTRSQGTDPETASQDAVIAASQAFERANERYRESITNDFLFQSNSKTSTNLKSRQSLSRQPSVRFVGAAAVNRRQSIQTRDNQHRRNDSTATGRTTNSSIDRAENFIEMSANLNETNTPEDDVASTPSSYRRVRKTKSLFSTRSSDPMSYPTGLLEKFTKPEDVKSLNQTSLNASEKQLRAPKSTSFLRGGYDYLTPSIRRRNDEAIAAARDTYLQQVHQQQLNKAPSFSLTPGAIKRQRAFRKTVRTSNKTYGSAISSPNQGRLPAEKGLGAKARRISFTLANGFKRVFRKNTDTEDAIPLQQVEAARPHFGDYQDTQSSNPQGSYGDGDFDDGTSSQCQSRVPSLHIVPFVSGLYARNESRGSFYSEEGYSNGKSRVTSWTDSTAANTLATREAVQRKRLSIIREFSSPRRETKQTQGLRDTESIHDSEEHDQSPGPVDSQRVYSALQKRINGSKFAQDSIGSPKGFEKIGSNALLGPSKSVPLPSEESHKTIRKINKGVTTDSNKIGSKNNLFSPIIYQTDLNRQEDDVFSPKYGDLTRSDYSQLDLDDENSVRTVSRLSSVTNRVLEPTIHEDPIRQLTPQEIANRYEQLKPDRDHVLREAKSSFFPYSPGNRFKSPSPYRRALGASSRAEEHVELRNRGGLKYIPKMEQRSTSRDDSVAESESMYSRTTSGNEPIISGTYEPSYDTKELPGTAVIITDRNDAGFYTESRSSASPENILLANNFPVSRDYRGLHTHQQGMDHTPKHHRHTRESAQIDDEDVEIGTTTSQKRGFGPMHALPQTALKSRSSFIQFGQENLDIRPSGTALIRPKKSMNKLSDTASARSSSVLQTFDQNIRQGRNNSQASTRLPSTDVFQSTSRRRDQNITDKSKFTEHLDEPIDPKLNRTRSTATMKLRFAPDPDTTQDGTNNENIKFPVSESATRISADKPNDSAFEDYYDKLYGSGKTRDSAPKLANSRMVDIFLSSRRRRMRMSDDSGTVAFV